MSAYKRVLCAALAVLAAASMCGCFMWGGQSPYPNYPQKTDAAQTPSATQEAPLTPSSTQEASATQSPEPAGTEAAEEDANKLFEFLDLELFRSMAVSSSDTYNQCIAGDPERFGIDPADVEKGWGDYYTYEGHVQDMQSCREVLDMLDDIDRDKLSDQNRSAYDTIRRCYEMSLMFEDYYYYDEPLTPMNGMHTALPLTMVCISIRSIEDVETYVFLLEDMPRIIDQLAEYENDKAEHGLFMTETALDQVVESCESFADTGRDCFLISYFDTIADKAKQLGMSDADIAAMRTRSDNAVLNGILPAYQRLVDSLEANRPNCRMLKGAAAYGEASKIYFDLSVQKEAGTLEDIDVLIDRLEDMGDSMFYEMIYTIYHDPEAFSRYGEPITFGSVDEDMDWLASFTEKYYPAMPEHDVEYITIPEDIAEDFSPAAYLVPCYDDYYDNTILLNPTSEDTTQLLTLAHEGAPGHMYQFLYFRNMPGLSLTQQLIEPTGCAEGWTVFTEYFVSHHCEDLGTGFCSMMNAENVYGNIFLPAYISLQVNHNGWDVERVEDYLDEMGMGEYADLMFEYAVTMPVYAMSYAIGFTYMYDMYMEQNISTPQQHKAFFEKVLSCGPTYLDMLEDHMK